jgi:transcriptional regulator with XRE-family HTH domain
MSPRWLVRSGRDLGTAVAELRQARGLTQEQLARQLGIDRTYLARLENGLSVQLLERALLLLRRLGAEVVIVSPDELTNDATADDGESPDARA